MSYGYEELVNFIAAGNTCTDAAKFTPSKKARERVWALLRRAKSDDLSAEHEN